MSQTLLTKRLRKLEELGIVERAVRLAGLGDKTQAKVARELGIRVNQTAAMADGV